MTKPTFDLTPFYRNTIGLDRLFDRITSQLETATTNYPPYDIVRVDEFRYEIRVAAAGFSQDEIDVEFQEGRLTVTGTHASNDDEQPEYMHHGISNRAWVRSWMLAEYVEVRAATMKNGILTIQLERVVPESQKARKIAITYVD